MLTCHRKQVHLLNSLGGKKWEHFILSKQELMYFSLSSFSCITKLVCARKSGGRKEVRHLEPVQTEGMAE